MNAVSLGGLLASPKPVWIWLYQAIFGAYVPLMALLVWAMPAGHLGLIALCVLLAISFILVNVSVQLRPWWARWVALAAYSVVFFTHLAITFIQLYVFGYPEPTIPTPSAFTVGGMLLLFVPLVGSSEVVNYFKPRPTPRAA